MLDKGVPEKFNHLCEVASLMPNPTNALPTTLSSHCLTLGLPEKRCVTLPAIHATNVFQKVLTSTNTKPSARKATVLCGLTAATNCGMNETKNSTTFGFSTLVTKPCVKSCCSDFGAARTRVASASSLAFVTAGFAKINRTPR